MPNSYTCLNYHVIFSTKDRYPFIETRYAARTCPPTGAARDWTRFVPAGFTRGD